ncbi:MAG: chemotaxis protein CheW [Thermodesulfovibrionales bacterium]|nr:chemotaxis protein CheW [Thermodesulfovibrionales bacterium]
MSAYAVNKSASMEEINLLFFKAGGLRMAVEASQVSEMMDAEGAANSGLPLVRLDEMLPLPEGQTTQGKTFLIGGNKPYGVVVDSIDEIAAVGIDSLRPMPPLAASGSVAIWGVCLRGDDILLLVDFQRLAGPVQAEEKER